MMCLCVIPALHLTRINCKYPKATHFHVNAMNFYPAIDLKDGKAVRLLRGDMAKATIFSEAPMDQATAFAEAGCKWLHLVDLNGAFAGEPVNVAPVDSIISATNASIQLGGGIRDMNTIGRWLEKGITRVILGTAAVEKPGFVQEAAKTFPGQVAVGIDARNGDAATRGWASSSGIKVVDVARRYENAGVAAIIYTDINRDGAMKGPNVEATEELANAVSIPVIASGGVSCLKDIQTLCQCEAPLEGIISGRALYDGMFSLQEALKTIAKFQN